MQVYQTHLFQYTDPVDHGTFMYTKMYQTPTLSATKFKPKLHDANYYCLNVDRILCSDLRGSRNMEINY